MSEPEEFDAYTLRHPKRGKRISAITGKATALNPETELQIQLVTHYRKRCLVDAQLRHFTRLYAIAPSNGNVPMHLRVLAKRAGVVRGVYDLTFMDKRRGFRVTWIECKVDDGRLTPEQQGFMEWLSDTPIRAVECRSLSEFIALIGTE